ncbi:MAG: DUF2961 domain-containing protein [Armatimonadia bacterium]
MVGITSSKHSTGRTTRFGRTAVRASGFGRTTVRPYVLAVLVCVIPAAAQDLTRSNPENVPVVLQQPLKLLATTAMSGVGKDYYSLKPGQSAVIGEVKGPAVIFRVWSTSSKSAMVSLDMTVDGKTERLYTNGKLPTGALKDDPLRAMDMQAYWSYVPVFVSKQAVFRATSIEKTEEIKLYLQAGYRTVTAAQLAEARAFDTGAARAAAKQILAGPETNVAAGQATEQTLQTGKAWDAPVTGPAMVTMSLTPPQGTTPEQLAATRLVVTCDGTKTIDVPLGAMFGVSHKLTEYVTPLVAVKGGSLLLRAPMPVAKSLQVALKRYGRGGLRSVQAKVWITPLTREPQYRLCAQYFSQVSVQDKPMTLLNTTWRGIFLGTNLSVNGLEKKTFAFLEGNEQIYVDGATKPTLEGTGTEDYFNGAWYFEAGEVQHLFHGVTFVQLREPPMVDCYRHMVSDSIPFSKGLRFDLQHGSRNKAPDVVYDGVMLWYQTLPVTIAEPREAAVPGAEGAGVPLRKTVVGAVALIVVAAFVVWVVRRRGA